MTRAEIQIEKGKADKLRKLAQQYTGSDFDHFENMARTIDRKAFAAELELDLSEI